MNKFGLFLILESMRPLWLIKLTIRALLHTALMPWPLCEGGREGGRTAGERREKENKREHTRADEN
jgi:hypothetical protein